MTPHELRYGNWIGNRNNFPMCITAIFIDTVYLDFDGNEGDVWEEDIKDLKPIPLTPEVLEKCGFVMPSKNDHHGGMLKDIGDNIAIRLKPLVFVDGYYWDNFNGAYKVIVKYLHQLQNLIYFLSGEEINYKP